MVKELENPHDPVPDFRYALCDLAGLTDEQVRGEVLLRATMLLMKHIADPKLAQHIPGIFGLLRALSQRRTVLEYLETLLTYLATANDAGGLSATYRSCRTGNPADLG